MIFSYNRKDKVFTEVCGKMRGYHCFLYDWSKFYSHSHTHCSHHELLHSISMAISSLLIVKVVSNEFMNQCIRILDHNKFNSLESKYKFKTT